MFFSYFIAFSFFLNCSSLYCSQYNLYRARSVRISPAAASPYVSDAENDSDGDKENSSNDKLSNGKLSAASERLIKDLEACVAKFVLEASATRPKPTLVQLQAEAVQKLRAFKSMVNSDNATILISEKPVLMKRYKQLFQRFDTYNKILQEKNKPKTASAKITKQLPQMHAKSDKKDKSVMPSQQQYQRNKTLVQAEPAMPIYAARVSKPNKLSVDQKKENGEKRPEQPAVQVQVPPVSAPLNDQLQQLIERVQERVGDPISIIQAPVIHMSSEPLPAVSPIRVMQAPEVTKQTNWPKKVVQIACITGFVSWVIHKVCVSDQEEQQVDEQQ
jgi:hypothetical protein